MFDWHQTLNEGEKERERERKRTSSSSPFAYERKVTNRYIRIYVCRLPRSKKKVNTHIWVSLSFFLIAAELSMMIHTKGKSVRECH